LVMEITHRCGKERSFSTGRVSGSHRFTFGYSDLTTLFS
jgi:hypothetical protein